MGNKDRIKVNVAEIEGLIAAGQLNDAERQTRRLLRRSPGSPTLLFLLGVIAGARNDFLSASKLLAGLCDSGRADFRVHLLMCRALEHVDSTAASNRYVSELQSKRWGPEQIGALNAAYLGYLGASGRYTEILEFVDSTPSLLPSPEIDLLVARGIEAVCGLEAAISHLEHSDYTTTSALHRFNLGTLYEKSLQLCAAIRNYRLALELDPSLDDAAYNLGILELVRGEFEAGWVHYSRRWGATGFKSRLGVGASGNEPTLSIQSRSEFIGRRIELLPEQGLGEQLLFLTCISELEPLASSVKLALEPRLISALRLIPRFESWCAEDVGRDERCDLSIPLGLLPQVFRRGQSQFPGFSSSRSLGNRRPLVSMRATLLGCRKVGLCLSSSSVRYGEKKSMPPEAVSSSFPELLGINRLVNLDHLLNKASDASRELESTFPNLAFPDGLNGTQGLDRLVQEIKDCDAVVTVSCTVAHFAGTIGIPCFVLINDWVLSKYWYWNHTSDDGISMWYHTVTVVKL